MTDTKFEQTHISMILDRSGSMSACRTETITAVNKYLADARADANLKESDFCLTIFDSTSIDDIRTGAPVNVTNITDADFVPRNWTPLYDAIGRGIDSLDKRTKASGSGKAVLVIVTDGAENASTKYSHAQISQMIKARQEAGWMVVFLGAGLDAAQQGAALGVRSAYTANIGMDSASLGSTMDFLETASASYSANANTQAARSWLASGKGDLTAEQRKKMGDATAGAGLKPVKIAGRVKEDTTPVAALPKDQSDAWANKDVDRDAWSN